MTGDHEAGPASGLSRHPFAPEAVARAGARRLAELFVDATRWGGWQAQQAIVTRWEELRAGAIEWAGATGDREPPHAPACLEMDTGIADFGVTDARDPERIETVVDLFTRAGDTARALDLEHLLAVGLDGDAVRGDMLLDRTRACGGARVLVTALSRTRIDGGDPDAARARLAEPRALGIDVMSEPMTRMRMGRAVLGLGAAFDGILDLPDPVDACLLDDEFPALRAARARRRADPARQTGQGAQAVAILRAEADRQCSMGMTVEVTRLMHRASEQLEDLARGRGDEREHRRLLAEGRDWLEEHGRHEEAVRWDEDHRDDPGPWNDPSGSPAGGGAA